MMKFLLDRGLLHGDCLTVTGQTIAQSLENVGPYPSYPDKQDIIRPWEDPIKDSTHLRILRGNLAPEGSVGKITGKEGLHFKGTAKVYEGEEDALKAFSLRMLSLGMLSSFVTKALLVARACVKCSPRQAP